MSRVASFTPSAILQILPGIRSKHQALLATSGEPSPSLIADLRERLRETPTQLISSLARALPPRMLHAGLYLLTDDEVGEKSVELLRARPRADLMRFGWRFLLHNYRIAPLEQLIPEWQKTLGWAPLITAQIHGEDLHEWFSPGAIDRGLLLRWQRTGSMEGVHVDDWLESFGLGRFESLRIAVWRRTLTEGSFETLHLIGAPRLLQVAAEHPSEIQIRFGRHYLTTLGAIEGWDERVLVWVSEKFGIPKPSDTQNHFWRGVSEAVRDEFRRWHAHRTLEEFLRKFDDPDHRFDFWAPFVDREIPDVVLRAEDPSTHDCVAICMRFRGWGVVEFGPVGNAAYIYPEPAYSRIVAREGRDTSAYKDRSKTLPVGPRSDGRIVHATGWQEVYRPVIERLIETHGPRRSIRR